MFNGGCVPPRLEGNKVSSISTEPTYETGIVSTNGEWYETHWAVYNPRDRWNGFLAAPAFDAYSIVTMLDEISSEDFGGAYSYDFDAEGALIFTEYQEVDEDPYVDRMLPDEDGLYRLGERQWVWTEASPEWADCSRLPLDPESSEGLLQQNREDLAAQTPDTPTPIRDDESESSFLSPTQQDAIARMSAALRKRDLGTAHIRFADAVEYLLDVEAYYGCTVERPEDFDTIINAYSVSGLNIA